MKSPKIYNVDNKITQTGYNIGVPFCEVMWWRGSKIIIKVTSVPKHNHIKHQSYKFKLQVREYTVLTGFRCV